MKNIVNIAQKWASKKNATVENVEKKYRKLYRFLKAQAKRNGIFSWAWHEELKKTIRAKVRFAVPAVL